jgi:hypothetical protein
MKFLKHSLLSFFTLLIFITSTGLTVNLHYKTVDLNNISDKPKFNTCIAQAPLITSCKQTSLSAKIKKPSNCCKNQNLQTKPQTKLTTKKVEEDGFFSKSITFINSYFESILNFSSSDKDEKSEKENTLFPLLKKGLYMLLQQYRD